MAFHLSLSCWRSLAACALTTTLAGLASAADYYVCAENGRGRRASMEQPAADLGNIIPRLVAGDTVHIAGGVYTGRGDNGADLIAVPVSIIGGYSNDFQTRDPWGAHRTILSGVNASDNRDGGPRLAIQCQKFREAGDYTIVVDGIIVDNRARNRYSPDGLKIERKANPSSGENATPETAGILVKAPSSRDGSTTISVRNCVVINCAPTTGALSVWGYRGTSASVNNNLIVNNTGAGIECNSTWHPREAGDQIPQFEVANNSVLFTWKYDSYGGIGGCSLIMDRDTVVRATNNVFAFADAFLVDNVKQSRDLLVANNHMVGAVRAAYREFDTSIPMERMEDEAQLLDFDSMDNVADPLTVAMPENWAQRYAGRTLIDRNAVEADVAAADTAANAWRSMLGLPLDGGSVDADADIWLHPVDVEAVLAAGSPGFGAAGCSAERCTAP